MKFKRKILGGLRLFGSTGFLTHEQRQWCAMILLSLIVSVEFLENIMFVFSASHIMGGVDADPRSFALVQSAYAVGSMLMIVKQQWLARRFGYRRYLTGALGTFIVGTLFAATSAGLTQLVAARFIQGVGGGALFTSSRVLIPIMFAPGDRPRAQRIFMIGIFTASALAPALAAELIDHGVWQDIFYGALPFAFIAAAGAWLLLPDAEPQGKAERPALIPLLWFGAAIAALQIAMSEARFDIFSHPVRLIALAMAGALLLIGFLRHQWRHNTPLLQLRVLHNPVYLTGLAMYFMYYLISYLSGYVFPIYAERALEIPVATVGWLNTLAGMVSLAGILAYIRYAPRLKRKKPLMIAGLLIMAAAAWQFSSMPPDIGPNSLIPSLAAKGLFGVLVIIPIAGLTFRGLSDSTFAHGYQSKNLMRQVASSFAAALGAVLLQNRQFSVHAALAVSVGQRPAIAMQWMQHIQNALTARGMDAKEAGQTALSQLTGLLDQQALLIASEDVYRLIAVLAMVGALVVLAQRRLG
jgi:predicted MFS family arabinose efflux permease